jgi:hypothetical protein
LPVNPDTIAGLKGDADRALPSRGRPEGSLDAPLPRAAVNEPRAETAQERRSIERSAGTPAGAGDARLIGLTPIVGRSLGGEDLARVVVHVNPFPDPRW